MIECHNNEKLINFYANHHFAVVAKNPDHNETMVQMIRRIV